MESKNKPFISESSSIDINETLNESKNNIDEVDEVDELDEVDKVDEVDDVDDDVNPISYQEDEEDEEDEYADEYEDEYEDEDEWEAGEDNKNSNRQISIFYLYIEFKKDTISVLDNIVFSLLSY